MLSQTFGANDDDMRIFSPTKIEKRYCCSPLVLAVRDEMLGKPFF